MKQLPSAPVKLDYFALKGGLNLTSPPLTMPPGFAIEAVNFECDINGGYSRVAGYERVDGRDKPSNATLYRLPVSTTGTWAVGNTITGFTSGHTAVYLATVSGYLIVTKQFGTFQAGENLTGGSVTGVASGTLQIVTDSMYSAADLATYQNLASDVYRALIGAVPGSGSILGVFQYIEDTNFVDGEVVHAFRNNSAGTRAGLYKTSSSGWTAVHELNLTFTSGGTYVMAVGNTITGATSAATGVISRVVVRSGSFAGGDAAGTLTITTQTGTFVAETINVGANINVANISGNSREVFGREMSFTSGGTGTIVPADVIVGDISGATATIVRVVLESGSWAAGTAAGRFIFTEDSGTFTAETVSIGIYPDVATVAGPSTEITFTAGGRFEFDIHSFSGDIGLKRVYGCDGVNRGFEFDGTVMVPINTGMTTDTPNHVIVHNEQLFFSFDTSVQHSGIATPYIWSAILGAGEIAVGDPVSGFMRVPGNSGGGALLIVTRNRAFALYGNNSSDWVLTVAQDDAGALPYTMQHLNGVIALDDRGVTYIGASQNYGNFEQNTISGQIRPWIISQRNLAVASCRVREKNQYRLFFSNAKALYVTMANSKVAGMMPIQFSHTPTCASSTELADGSEAIYFGATNGYVYQMEKGTSHDGEPINYLLVLAYNNLRSPQIKKQYRKAALEMGGTTYAEFSFAYQLGYNNSTIPQPIEETRTMDFSESNWDAYTWNSFTWDGRFLLPEECPMRGTADNVALIVSGSSDKWGPFTITGAMLHYTPRTRIR